MNRIDRLFSEKKNDILSIYFCAGAPTLEGTVDVLKALEANGVNMVEIGIPFSDPMADGPVIQDAATKALKNGMTLRTLFSQLEGIREQVSIPLLLMGYLNPVMKFGFEPFCARCKEVGIDGIIIPDLPFDDYVRDFVPLAKKYDLRFIMLITPETSEERIRTIDANTDGFIYMVSSASTTGAQKDFNAAKQEYFHRIDSMALRNPRMIGFGISNAATWKAAAGAANGGIIGSRFVSLMGKCSETARSAYDATDKAIKQLLSDIER